MKLVWKPLDVMRQRLYRVVIEWLSRGDHGEQEYRYVFADSPTDAASAMKTVYENATDKPDAIYGEACAIGQPAEWFDDRRMSPSSCGHNFDVIQSSKGMRIDEWIAICRDCGEIEVRIHCREKGFNHTVRLGIGCDDHLRHASKYLRSKAESEEALARAKRTGQQEPTE